MRDLFERDDSPQVTALPADFVFSQSSLQAYVDCKRRFWLTYLNRIPWPSAPASPLREFEQFIRLGATFHRMIQRAEEGIDIEALSSDMEFPLESWLHAYQEHRPVDLPHDYVQAEAVLETPIDVGPDSRRLMAKYDLVAAGDDGRTMIVDWKTGSKLTRPAVLQQKMQTSVYPYVLVEASAALPWGPVRPEQVEMRYWFVAAPENSVAFKYDAAQHASNHDTIRRLVQEIMVGRSESDFPKVTDTAFSRKYVCGFCTYRSLCNRGAEASDLMELDELASEEIQESGIYLDLSLEDVDEIPF
jgi:CRISPR/Cas system-associated exonuclease Cas4 (RecB family)